MNTSEQDLTVGEIGDLIENLVSFASRQAKEIISLRQRLAQAEFAVETAVSMLMRGPIEEEV